MLLVGDYQWLRHELAIINLNVDIIRYSLFSTSLLLMVNRLILIGNVFVYKDKTRILST